MLREWPRLRNWLDESRSDVRLERSLGQAAVEWMNSGQEPSFLLTGARLAQFQGWAVTSKINITFQEQAFLSSSIAEHERRAVEEVERSRRELEAARKLAETEKARAEENLHHARRLRQRAWYLAGVLLVTILAAFLAFTNGQRANSNLELANQNLDAALTSEQNRATQQAIAETEARARATQQAVAETEAQARATAEANALQERDQAQARELVAASINNMLNNGDPELSVLLALHSMDLSYSPDAETTLRQALLSLRKEHSLTGHTDIILQIAYSPDGKRIATASEDGTTRIWDTASGQEILTLPSTSEWGFTAVQYSPDGRQIATREELVIIWDGETGKKLLEIPAPVTGPPICPTTRMENYWQYRSKVE